MDTVVLALVASGVIAITSWWAAHGWSTDARRTRRVLRRARVVSIANLVDGKLACIVGRVEIDGEPVVAMITRKPCVAFDTTVQNFKGNNMTVPISVDVTRRMVPFFVVDETGRVRIDAPQAALCNKPISKNERHEERIIENGAKIRIVGSVRLEPTLSKSEHLFREGGFTATITGTSKYPLLVDDER